ncbi:MAG TPA: hypothetical protein VMF06_00290, partial [Candidatus Limnocylindria bacterium]|nr:hypothetical protein [Candidatus Limnocylindria bacterium]
MNDSDQHESSSRPQPKLAAALGAMPRSEVFVPRAVDDAILAAARRQLERQAPRRRRMRVVPLLALAAVLVAIGSLVALFGWGRPSKDALVLDINGDGRFDILDAF